MQSLTSLLIDNGEIATCMKTKLFFCTCICTCKNIVNNNDRRLWLQELICSIIHESITPCHMKSFIW